jgi:hypothetical protein
MLSFVGMNKCHRSPIDALLEAFNKAKSKCEQSNIDFADCLIIEKPYVFDLGLGSKIYVLIVDIRNIYIGSSFYYNE